MKWQYFPSVGIKAPLQQWDMSHYGLVLDLAKMCDARLGEAAAATTTRRLPMALLLVLLLAHQGAAMSLDRLALERNELPQAEQTNAAAGDVVVDDMKMAAVPALANGNTDMYMLVPESLASQLDDTEHVHRNTIESESEAEPALPENADMLMLESDDTPAMQLVELPSDITVAESEPEAQTESQLDTQSESEPEITVASPELIEEHVVEHPVEEEEEEQQQEQEQAAPAASSQEVQLETVTEANEVETHADDELPAEAEAEQATEKQTVEEAQPEVEQEQQQAQQPVAEEVDQQADAEEEQAKPAEEESKADAEPVEQNEVDTTEASLMESMAEGIEDGLSVVMGDLLPEESHVAPVQAELEKSDEQAQEPEQEEEVAVQPEETQNEIDSQTAAPEIEVETATESAQPVQADAVEQPSAEEADQAQPEQPSAEQAQPEQQAEGESQAEPEQVEKDTQNDAEPQPSEVQPSEELIAIPAAETPKEEAEAEAEPVVETEKLNEVLSDETPEAVEAQAAPVPEQVEQSQSQEEPQAEAQQEPQADVQHEPQAEAQQEPQVEAQAAPEIAPQADTPAEPQPESQQEPQSDVSQPEAQPETQPESQPEPQPEAEAEPQPEAQPETQPEAQPEPQPEVQPEPQPESQPEPQPAESQAESQPEPQAASQPEPQAAESQPEIQADDQSEVPAEPIRTEQQSDTPTLSEPQPEPEKQSILTTIIPVPAHVPVHVEDSVLNYVNASFMQPEQELQKTELEPEATYNAHLRRYDGAQVWRIVVQTDKDKKLADELQSKYDGQLWKEVKQEVDYLLKPQVLAAAERHIRAANLSRIVLIDNLQQVIEVENPPAEKILELQNRKGHRLTWQAYHRLQDIHGFIDYMAKTYPDICSTEIIGYSVEKRPLKILKISNGNARNPGIWIDGGMHAREWISPATVTFIANQLAEGWEELPEHMRNINWYIHPVANPDGYEYSHTTDRLWRKNMRAHGRQCPGVDLNRNFGYKWGGKGTSASPCSQTYRGSKAFSEPETFYISKFISGFPRETFQAYLSFHSYGQYILYPWGYDYHLTKDRADLDRVARQAGTIITRSSGVKYTVGSSATTLYPAAGGSDDWAKGIAGIKYAYTVEMGDTGRYGFVLPAQFIESNAKDGYTFADTVARAIIQGKSGRSNTSRRRIH